jgi:excinuclease ABC subunit A
MTKPNSPPQPFAPIRLKGVRQNNLKNISIEIPQRKLTVITGLSGSGKSTLAFDTLYAEGQRRYVESLSTYTRQFLEKMPKPELDSIENIPPAIALEQRNPVQNSRSTVATQTEMLDYLRLFYSKLGQLRCPVCEDAHPENFAEDIHVERISHAILDWAVQPQVRKVGILAPLAFSAEKADKKTGKNMDLKSKTFLATYFTILTEQSFRKLYWTRNQTWIDLSEPPPAELTLHALMNQELFLLMDRFANLENPDKDTVTRFKDSLDQTLRFGHQKVMALDLTTFETKHLQTGFGCITCNTQYPRPTPQLFSFNSPIGACSNCKGFGHTLDLDERKVFVNPKLSILDGVVDPFSKPSMKHLHKKLILFCEKNKIRPSKRLAELTAKEKALLWTNVEAGFETLEEKKYKFHIRIFIRRYQSPVECKTCQGSRLNPTALRMKIRDRTIADLMQMPVSDLLIWIQTLKLNLNEKSVLKDLYPQMVRRLEFLCRVGVPYLTLNRLTRTLSGGEYQRINLATHLGNGLCGTLYVLDEPTIGLHPHDTDQLLQLLRDLRDQGNTVVVVEHELKILKDADWIIELGPEAGKKGGAIVAQGTPADVAKMNCKTARYLKPDLKLKRHFPLRPISKTDSAQMVTLTHCREHNLKDITLNFPLHRLVVFTGVSGSGKTTLVHGTLAPALKLHLDTVDLNSEDDDSADELPSGMGAFEKITGHESIERVILLDQKAIGKNSRSNPATYLKAWDEIRKIFANQSLAVARGYSAGFFSFNVDGGRCPTCKGEGEVAIDMHFMAEIKLKCEDCEGRRFTKPILDVRYKNKSISDFLEMTIDDAYDVLHEHPVLRRKLLLLKEVGLGYVELGQSGPTLSGGEAQRLKIAAALDQEEGKANQHDLFILDEPTTGLHQEDVEKLIQVLQDLVNRGKSVLVIEHHLEVIANSDFVVDLGPDGGAGGGELLMDGPPEKLKGYPRSKTGAALKSEGYF